MRVLVTCQPAHGHFRPLVPLLRALEGAGHPVVVATSAAFAQTVAAEGFATRTIGPDWLEGNPAATWADLAGGSTTVEGIGLQIGDAFQRAARATLPELLALVDRDRPDVVVHESDEFLAPLVGEHAGVPWVCVGVSLRQPRPGPNPLWDVARKALGLPPDPEQARLWPHLYLDPVPTSLQSRPTAELVAAARPMRPCAMPAARRQVQRGREPSRTRPLILVTLGTIFSRAEGLLRSLVDGILPLDVDILVATGLRVTPTELQEVVDHVAVVAHVPFDEVLAETAAVVHHAGSGTSLAVLAAGLPSVVVPLASDQPRNARTLVEAGTAVAVDHVDLRPARVTSALSAVLSSPGPREAARRLASEMAAMPAPEEAVGWVEALVGGAGGRSPAGTLR